MTPMLPVTKTGPVSAGKELSEFVELALASRHMASSLAPRPPETRWQRFQRAIGYRPPLDWTKPPKKPTWFLDVESVDPFRAYILAPGGAKVLVSRRQAATILGALGEYQAVMEMRNPYLRYKRT